jgi:hypothetical protein
MTYEERMAVIHPRRVKAGSLGGPANARTARRTEGRFPWGGQFAPKAVPPGAAAVPRPLPLDYGWNGVA